MEAGDGQGRGVRVLATPNAERHIALRAAIVREEPNLRRSVEALVFKRGLASNRADIAAIAGDVLQEAVERALRRADGYDPTRSAHAWLLGFVINVLREQQRATRVERNHTVQNTAGAVEVSDRSTFEAVLERLHDENSTDAYGVIELLDLVPATDGDVLRKRYVDNLSGPELAEALGGITEGSARVRLSRAKTRLAQAYRQAEYQATRNGEDG